MIAPETNEVAVRGTGPAAEEDRGAILVFVLIVIAVCSLVALPMLSYTTTVMRSGTVQSNRAQAVEFANGGTWALLANGSNLYDICNGGNVAVPLNDVTTSCDVLDTNTLRPEGEMPYEVATVEADRAIPAAFADTSIAPSGFPKTYTNPNTASDPSAWLTNSDWTPQPEAGKVWVPHLPVQATSPVVDVATSDRITTMSPGTQDPLYSSCRVFFPGTYNTPIVIDSPAYFASGVYSFNQPITLRDGADVVVGNGQGYGCTTDFEAVSSAVDVPDPLNMSGLGGTFVLGDRGRIVVDDDGSGEIRFIINQRYVSDDETGVAASSDVAIVSVNGQHAPLLAGETLGDDFFVSGVSAVPASKVGIDLEPAAVDKGYTPSVFTAKPTPPDPPTVTSAEARRNGTCTTCGWLRVNWTVPNNHGALITGYTATLASGQSCSPKTPTLPDTTVQPTCTITGVPHNTTTSITVTATNGYGTSAPSTVFAGPQVKTSGTGQSPSVAYTSSVRNAATTPYTDGFRIAWDPPAIESGVPPIQYNVAVEPSAGGGPVINCVAWWDEGSCIIRASAGLTSGIDYRIRVTPIVRDGSTPTEYTGGPVTTRYLTFVANPADGPAPAAQVAATAGPLVVTPILDFTTDTATDMEIVIDGYVSVPQGRILISATTDPAGSSVEMSGGVLAGDLDIEPSTAPASTSVLFDNPVAQKRVQIVSRYDGKANATSNAVVQVNRSGSLAINSWVVQ